MKLRFLILLLAAAFALPASAAVSAAVVYSSDFENDGSGWYGDSIHWTSGTPGWFAAGANAGSDFTWFNGGQWLANDNLEHVDGVSGILGLQAGTYTIGMSFGNPNNGPLLPTIEYWGLRTNNNNGTSAILQGLVSAQSEPAIPTDNWVEWTKTYVIPEGHALIGQNIDWVVFPTSGAGSNAVIDGPMTITYVPEPSTLLLSFIGCAALLRRRR